MIYLYAISELPPSRQGAPGLDGAPLCATCAGGLHAVHSEHDVLDVTPTATALMAHEAVVDELLGAGAILPFRFGTALESERQLRELLEREQERFRALLARVRGRVELAVRVSVPSELAPATNGASYLSAKLARRRAGDQVLKPLEAFAAETARPASVDDPFIKASFLVPDADVERFAGAVRELQRSHPQLTLSCTGPWPPYSFVAEGSS